MSRMYDYDPRAEEAALAEQAEAAYEEQYAAWRSDMVEDGHSEEEVSREAYDEHLVEMAEAAAEDGEWALGCGPRSWAS